jgi:hypothetical protein
VPDHVDQELVDRGDPVFEPVVVEAAPAADGLDLVPDAGEVGEGERRREQGHRGVGGSLVDRRVRQFSPSLPDVRGDDCHAGWRSRTAHPTSKTSI